MKSILAFVRREALLLGGVALSAIQLAVSNGTSIGGAIQVALPTVLAAALRTITTPTPTKECDPMADLTALQAAAAELSAAAASVQSVVATLKSEATAQADVDAVTSTVTSAVQTIQSAVA